jgi:hypothetical protein
MEESQDRDGMHDGFSTDVGKLASLTPSHNLDIGS